MFTTLYNPIDIILCWQALIFALMIYMLTQFTKQILPYIYNPKTKKGKLFIKRILLPSIPPILGFVGSVLIPIHPEVLIVYVNDFVQQRWDGFLQAYIIYGSWGSVVGLFADYIYTKATTLLGDYKLIKS